VVGFGPTMGSLSELAFLFVPAAFESSFLLRPLSVCGTKHTIAEAPTAAVLVVPVVRSSLVVATRLAVVAFVVCFSGCCCCCCYRGSADKRLPACCCAAVVCPRPPSFLVCVAFHNFAQQLPVRLSLSLSLSLCLSVSLSVWLLLVRLLLLLQRVFFSLFGLFVSFGGFLPGGLRPGRDRVCVCFPCVSLWRSGGAKTGGPRGVAAVVCWWLLSRLGPGAFGRCCAAGGELCLLELRMCRKRAGGCACLATGLPDTASFANCRVLRSVIVVGH